MKRITTFMSAIMLVFALTACGASQTDTEPEAEESAAAPAEEVTVRIGLTGTFNEDIWAPTAEVLEKEGIHLEYVQFSNFSLPNDALNNGDIEMNAFQHHAFLENEIANYGYEITPIGDTYIIPMSIFSDKITDLSQLKDGDTVAIPNDATNGGRALKLLESAGILTTDPAVGASPTISDITDYNIQVEFVEVDANLVYSTMPDVTIAVVNGNYALDSGLRMEDALFQETEFADNSYFALIAVRTEDAENPVYQRIVEVYQSQRTIDVFNNEFSGFFIPAWTLDVE